MAAETLEHVRCDLCGADDAEPVLILKDRMFETTPTRFRLVRCRTCALYYLDPRPAVNELERYYQENYAPFSRSGIAGRVKNWTIRREVNALWSALAPPVRVIDVGCATGDLLQGIRERGNPNVLGIEPSPLAAEITRERWGIDVFTGTLEEARLRNESVDVVIMSHTIEHLPSPSSTIAEVNRVLKPGGLVILWLPNAASFAAQLFGEWWIGWDAPRHLYDFTPATLNEMLDQCGFTVRSVCHEWVGLEWSWAVRLFLRDRISSHALDGALATLHPALTLAATPISLVAAVFRRGGRIRATAVKRDET